MEIDRNKRIGTRIRMTRERHGLHITDVANRTAGLISTSRIANYERGIRRPDIEDAEALAAAFGDVSPAWLLTLEEDSDRLERVGEV